MPDAIVIGCGPAAFPAAIHLAEVDWSVLAREAAREPDEAVL